jgi:hypothetical protein
MDKIAHCFLIDDGSGPSVMSKIIMEELGLSCTNENSRSILSYNSLKQSTIGEIKDVTLVLCTHLEIRTTLNIQVIDMLVSNYSIILERDWQALTGGYLSLDGTHLSVMQEHHSKPAMCQPASTSSVFNGEERRNPLTFKFQI